jgi:hypothetical protein
MKEKEDLDVEVMFNQACAFVDCAEFTRSEKYKIEHRTYSHGYAGISLSALACEIFIKCLIVKAGPDCPEIDGDFCHQIAGKPAGSSLPPAGLIHENSHSNTTFTA